MYYGGENREENKRKNIVGSNEMGSIDSAKNDGIIDFPFQRELAIITLLVRVEEGKIGKIVREKETKKEKRKIVFHVRCSCIMCISPELRAESNDRQTEHR